MSRLLEQLVERYPDLQPAQVDIQAAIDLLINCYRSGGKLLICGNGGSAADCEHIVGELMKGFFLKRPLPVEMRRRLIDAFPAEGEYLADHLQGALPAISLVSQSGIISAFSNDVAAEMVFAQQVYGYGQPGDIVLGISTSGNSKNVIHALQVGRALGLSTLGLTGESGGQMKALCDVAIRAPFARVDAIQERHLAIYHVLCAAVEATFFST
ncbi:MAG: SIS domain-containing protein [Caldilineaceae bacterium]|nr:SIS domain-containing protein [Caldilineaceae bacterium]